jgi:hypothetical protein
MGVYLTVFLSSRDLEHDPRNSEGLQPINVSRLQISLPLQFRPGQGSDVAHRHSMPLNSDEPKMVISGLLQKKDLVVILLVNQNCVRFFRVAMARPN